MSTLYHFNEKKTCLFYLKCYYRKYIEKTKEKISEFQKKLRSLEAQLVEEENLEIVRMVKAVKVTVSGTWGDPSARVFEIRCY